MEKEVFEIAGLRILEPGTLISDILMGFASLYFYFAVRKIASMKYQQYLSYFFLFIGISGLTGAFAHSLFLYTGKSLHFISWMSTAIAVYFFESGVSPAITVQKRREIYMILIKIQLGICIILTSYYANFLAVKINTAIGLLGIVFPVLLVQFFKEGERNNLYVLIGITLAILPAFFHKLDVSIGQFFNMNDLSHFFLILCLFFIFKGMKKTILYAKLAEEEAIA